MKVCIIGAGGFVGTHLHRELDARGVEVIAISSRDGWFDRESGVLKDLPAGTFIEAVVYLSQSPHYRDLPLKAAHVWAVNVLSAIKAVAWARQSGASRFIYASSGSVYVPSWTAHGEDEPLRRDDGYALSKIHGEEAVAAFAGSVGVVRPRFFGVYGPLQRTMLIPRLVDTIARGQAIRLHPNPADPADLDGLRLSLTYVDDVVDVLVAAVGGNVPPVFNVAGSEVVSIRRLGDVIGARIGIEPRYEIDPDPRHFDLIGDDSWMRRILKREPVPVGDGVARAVDELLAWKRQH